VPADLPKDDAAVELEDAQVWDLVSAFNRVMTAIGRGSALHEVTYDDTPIELWAEELLAAVATGGPTTFDEVFSGRRAKGELVGLFLALLELVRKKRLTAQQDVNFGTIYLVRLEEVADEDDAVEDTPPRPIGPRLVQPEEDEQLETPRSELEPAPKDIAADEHAD
jgi:chromatin segregation and condensation protein Rec8/ScpA/Scc1 (kleisin family)